MSALISTDSYDPNYPSFPIISSLSIVLVCLPAYWHFKSRNIGTSLYIIWTFLGNLIFLVNSIVWAHNLREPVWFWCDLSSAVMVALTTGLPSATLLITHRLHSIATIRQVHVSQRDNRRKKYFELALGLGLPVLSVILHVVVQGHRFDIIENVGCWPSTYVTPVTIPLLYLPPVFVNLASAIYASLSIRAFLRQRKQFSDVLQSANSGLTVSRYFRLMALAGTEIVCSLPASIYLTVANSLTGMHPWISWEDTHLNFNRIEYYPYAFFRKFPNVWILICLSRWTLPASGILFFIYLGLSGESGTFYRKHFWRFMRQLGFPVPSDTSPGASWIARPGASGPSQLRSLPPLATTASVASSTMKKPTSSVDFYEPSGDGKANSSTDSIPLSHELCEQKGDDLIVGDQSPRYAPAEVPSRVV